MGTTGRRLSSCAIKNKREGERTMGGSKPKQPDMEEIIQLCMFDNFLEDLRATGVVTAGQITEVVSKLQRARDKAERLERKEKRRREQEEKERKGRETENAREAHVQEVTSMDLPMDWENVFNGDKRAQGIHAESIPDGLILSLSNLGRVDIEYIASVTGEDCKTVITTLQGSIYQNPDTWGECFYKGWETAEEYLSGNLLQKKRAAQKADRQYNGYFAQNIRAIEKVLPPTVATEDIYITLGSPWVPTDVIDDFIEHLFGQQKRYIINHPKDKDYLKTKHDAITGTWEIPGKDRYSHNVATTRTYGTKRLEALHMSR